MTELPIVKCEKCGLFVLDQLITWYIFIPKQSIVTQLLEKRTQRATAITRKPTILLYPKLV
jgi:hypothetical protein